MRYWCFLLIATNTVGLAIASSDSEAVRDYCFARTGVEEVIWPFKGIQSAFDKGLILKVEKCIQEINQENELRDLYSNYSDKTSDETYRESLIKAPSGFSKFRADAGQSQSFQILDSKERGSTGVNDHEVVEGYTSVTGE